MINEFLCRVCGNPYNQEDKKPHMIPTCGHTICRSCLQKSFDSLDVDRNYVCDEDNIECMVGKNINLYPINQSIFKLISQQHDQFLLLQQQENIKKSQNYSFISQFSEDEEKTQRSISKIFSNPSSELIAEDDLYDQPSTTTNLCKEHKRKIELYCLDDAQNICTICALFGGHKSHNVKQFDDIIKEVELRLKSIILTQNQLRDKKQQINQQIFNQSENQLIQRINQEENTRISQHFDRLIEKIIERKKEIIKEAQEQNKSLILAHANIIQQDFKFINEKAEEWDSKTNKLVGLFYQDNLQNCADLFSEIFHPQYADIVQSGNLIIRDLEELNEKQQAFNFKRTHEFDLQEKTIQDFLQKIKLTSLTQSPYISKQQTLIQEIDSNKMSPLVQIDKIGMAQSVQPSRSPSTYQLKTQQSQESLEILRNSQPIERNMILSPKSTDESNRDSNKITKEDSQNEQQVQTPRNLGQKKNSQIIKPLFNKMKLSGKLEPIFNQIFEDKQEMVEIQQQEMSDENTNALTQVLKDTQNLKVLKILKSKLSDNGFQKILDIIEQTNIQSLHLQSNMITDKGMENFIAFMQKKKGKQLNLKSISLNQNQITVQKYKKKIDELKKQIQINI